MKIEQKYYVGNSDIITIRCVVCGKVCTIMPADFNFKQHVVKIFCPCSHSFDVTLEHRKLYRKQLDIAGSYRKINEPVEHEKPCNIKNISSNGIGFIIQSYGIININDELIVSFLIGILQQHRYETTCRVRHIDSGVNIGGIFTQSTID